MIRGASASYTFNLILAQTRKNAILVLFVFILTVIATVGSLAPPLILKQLVDVAIPSRDIRLLAGLLAIMALLPVVEVGLRALHNYFRASLGEAISQTLRRNLFNHLMYSRLEQLGRRKIGEIVFTLTRDCGAVGEVFIAQRVIPIIYNVIMFLTTFVVMLTLNWKLALVTTTFFPVSVFVTKIVAKRTRVLETEFRDVLGHGEAFLNEKMHGLRAIKYMQGERKEESKWQQWIRWHWRIKAKTLALNDLVRLGLTEATFNIARALIFGYGAFQIINGETTIGVLIAFVAYVPNFYRAMQTILDLRIDFERVRVAAVKIDELMSITLEDEKGVNLPSNGIGMEVAFTDVHFAYDRDGSGISDVSFTARPNEIIGIVGPSGGGKSTILDLLLGIHPLDSGTISIDGTNIESLALSSLRSQIAVVPQDVTLWNDSLLNNIRYPDSDLDISEVNIAAEKAMISELINRLPDGYDQLIGEKGFDLSQGERQRIAAARALLRKGTRLVLLDEPSSAVDSITEEGLMTSLRELQATSTVIIVAHRLKTVMSADKVLVIADGNVVEIGHPRELLEQKNGLFTRLYQTQQLPSYDGGT